MIHGRGDTLVIVPLKVRVRVLSRDLTTVPRAQHTAIVPAQVVRHVLYVLVKCVVCFCRGYDTFF